MQFPQSLNHFIPDSQSSRQLHGCCCCSRACKINLYFRCSHTSKEVSVIRCYNSFSVRKDSSCSSAAQSATWMCDNRTCFCQNIQCSVCQCLSIDLAACRCNDQLHKVCNFLPFEYFCCRTTGIQRHAMRSRVPRPKLLATMRRDVRCHGSGRARSKPAKCRCCLKHRWPPR